MWLLLGLFTKCAFTLFEFKAEIVNSQLQTGFCTDVRRGLQKEPVHYVHW